MKRPLVLFARTLAFAFATSATLPALADYAKTWTCDFGENYDSQVGTYLTLASNATATQTTGANTQKNGEKYLVLSDSVSESVSGGITSTFNFPYAVKLADGGYKMEFDYAPSRGSNNNNNTIYQLIVYDASGTALFNLYAQYDSDISVYPGSSTSGALGSFAALQKYNDDSTKANWIRLTITGSVEDNNVTLAITKLSDNSAVTLSSDVIAASYVALGKITVRTGNNAGRHQWAGLDDFNFQYNEAAGVTTLASGTITESIKFGAAVETAEAVTMTSVGSSAAHIYFSTENDNPTYGLSQTMAQNWVLNTAYLTIVNGTYAIKNNMQLGTGSGQSANRRTAYVTIENATMSLSGGIALYGGTVNVNSGTITQTGTMNVGASARSGDATFTINGGSVSSADVKMGQFGQSSTLNINGGSLTTGGFSRYYDYGAIVNLNGGALVASRENASFIPSGFTLGVGANGGTIDTAGYSIAITPTVAFSGDLTVKGGGKLTLSAVQASEYALALASGTTLDLGGQTNSFASATIGGVVTNGTLSVSGKATFTAGAVIDIGDTTPADGAVVMSCGSVEGLENLTVTANGAAVDYNVKFDSTNGIVLRSKGFTVILADNSTSIGEDATFDGWLTQNGYDIYTNDGITAMQSAIVTEDATTGMSPLEAYLLGYDDKDDVPNLAAEATSTGFTLTFDNNTPKSLSGLSVTYKVQKSSNNSDWDDATTTPADSGALSLAFDDAGLYNRLVATVAAAE